MFTCADWLQGTSPIETVQKSLGTYPFNLNPNKFWSLQLTTASAFIVIFCKFATEIFLQKWSVHIHDGTSPLTCFDLNAPQENTLLGSSHLHCLCQLLLVLGAALQCSLTGLFGF